MPPSPSLASTLRRTQCASCLLWVPTTRAPALAARCTGVRWPISKVLEGFRTCARFGRRASQIVAAICSVHSCQCTRCLAHFWGDCSRWGLRFRLNAWCILLLGACFAASHASPARRHSCRCWSSAALTRIKSARVPWQNAAQLTE